MNKIKEWKKSIDIRSSVPTFSKNIFKQEFDELKQETENLSITQKLNSNLLKYKEIKMLVKKTGISPAYFVYILFFLLIVIFIGYFEYYLTVIIATLYPLYISIKTLQGGEKEDRVQWLTYW